MILEAIGYVIFRSFIHYNNLWSNKDLFEENRIKAESGDFQAEYDCGEYLMVNSKTKEDTKLALQYYKNSAAHGNEKAKKKLENIKKAISPIACDIITKTYPEYYWIDWVKECKTDEQISSAVVVIKKHGLFRRFHKVDAIILAQNEAGETIEDKTYNLDYSDALVACNKKVYDLKEETVKELEYDVPEKKKLGCWAWIIIIISIIFVISLIVGNL